MEEVLGVGDADGEGAHADSAARAATDNDDRRRWVELHDVLHPRLAVADEVVVDEVRRFPAVRSRDKLQRPRSSGVCEEPVADTRWSRRDGVTRRRRSL